MSHRFFVLGYFNPRSREGSDCKGGVDNGSHDISIRAPARGATRGRQPLPPEGIFQSALPRGERLYEPCSCLHTLDISIRAPARGATNKSQGVFVHFGISIRAPARGATQRRELMDTKTGISIRAPARGATRKPTDKQLFKIFQSALPRGERHLVGGTYSNGSDISIRAPARGATSIFAKKFSSLLAKIV